MNKTTHFFKSLKAVFWSFFGVRKRTDLDSDTKIEPLYLIVAGFLGVIVFVGTLILIVKHVV